jgi:hypothetical protein
MPTKMGKLFIRIGKRHQLSELVVRVTDRRDDETWDDQNEEDRRKLSWCSYEQALTTISSVFMMMMMMMMSAFELSLDSWRM